MKRLVLALLTSTIFAVPAVAQQQPQGNSLGNTLEGIGRSLNGQNDQAPYSGNSRNDRQQTYNDTAQQYRSESNQQLQQDNQRLQAAQNRLDAASQALHQEMRRRGMAAENNENGQGYSGSSVPPNDDQTGGRGLNPNQSHKYNEPNATGPQTGNGR